MSKSVGAVPPPTFKSGGAVAPPAPPSPTPLSSHHSFYSTWYVVKACNYIPSKKKKQNDVIN